MSEQRRRKTRDRHSVILISSKIDKHPTNSDTIKVHKNSRAQSTIKPLLKLLCHAAAIAAALALLIFPATVTSSRAQRQRAQDVASASSSSSSSSSAAAAASSRVGALATHKMKSLDEFLEGLPELSVGQKHSASFECELAEFDLQSTDALELIWLRLNRSTRVEGGRISDDITPITLNRKLITRDARFKVRKHSARRWTLQLDNVSPQDSGAYFVCQLGGARVSSATTGTQFAGGARLNVLEPPKIIDEETSASFVEHNEFEQLVLRCSVVSEPQAQLMWKREDGALSVLDAPALEQRFKHQFERTPSGRVRSRDSSELRFEPFVREHAGAYLCIASNGVQPGVSRRVFVRAIKCRAGAARDAPAESCDEPRANYTAPTSTTTTTIASVSLSTAALPTNRTANARSRSWHQSARSRANAAAAAAEQQRRTQTANRSVASVETTNSAATATTSAAALIGWTAALTQLVFAWTATSLCA